VLFQLSAEIHLSIFCKTYPETFRVKGGHVSLNSSCGRPNLRGLASPNMPVHCPGTALVTVGILGVKMPKWGSGGRVGEKMASFAEHT